MAKVITTELQHSGASGANVTLDSSKNVTCENNLQVDGNVTVTGTLPADKLTGALPAISGASLTGIVSVPKENLVINGDFQVWQRSTDDTSDPVSGYCGPDRWKKAWYGGTVIGKQVAITSGTPYDEGFRYSFQQKVTSASTGNDRYSLFQYLFEAQDLATSGWKYVDSSSKIRVQFWAKSSLAGKYWVEFQSQDGTKRAYPYSFNLSADTWTKISYAIPGDSNITINNDTGTGGKLTIYTHLGTDYTNDSGTATATWKNQDGAASTEDYDQNWLNTANATWDIAGVQVTVGEDAGDFQHRSYTDELLRGQRYFLIWADAVKAGEDEPIGSAWYNNDSYKFITDCRFPVEMRAHPSVVVKNATNAFRGYGGGAGGAYVSTLDVIEQVTNRVGRVGATIALDTSSNGIGLRAHSSGSGYLHFNAEL